MNIIEEVMDITNGYLRTGGKRNRRKQHEKMKRFAHFCLSKGARNLAEVGQRHVIQFWMSLEHLKKSTRYAYYLAVCELWERAHKPGKPPKPRDLSESQLDANQ